MFYFITAITLILKELGLFWRLKKLIFPNDYYHYKKPFDCFFCLSFWANSTTLLFLLIFNYNTMHLDNFGIVLLLTKIIDLLWNKD